MFSHAIVFRLGGAIELPALETIEEALQRARFVPCGPTHQESCGWIAPRGAKSQALAERVAGQLILKLGVEKRAVPASAVKAAVDERIEKFKKETGHERVGAKLKREFKEEVMLDLLPRAFSKQSAILLWLDATNRLLVVDAASLASADKAVTALVETFCEILGEGFLIRPLQTNQSAVACMSHWLATREAPLNFTVDRDCELKTPDEQKSTVRYSSHTLEIDEVAGHIAAGKLPTRLAMTWNDRVSFVLNEAAQMRKLKLLDVALDGTQQGQVDDGFDTDVAILTGELSALIPDLLQALGGEVTE